MVIKQMTKGELINKLQELPVDNNTEVFVSSFWVEGEFYPLDQIVVDGLTREDLRILLSDNC